MSEKNVQVRSTFIRDVALALRNYLKKTKIRGADLAKILDVPDRTLRAVLNQEQVVESVEGFYALLWYVTGIKESDQTAVPPRRQQGGRRVHSVVHEHPRAWTNSQLAEWIENNKARLDTMSEQLKVLKETGKLPVLPNVPKPHKDIPSPDPVIEPVAKSEAEWAKRASLALKAWAEKRAVPVIQIGRDLDISRGIIERIGSGKKMVLNLQYYADLYDHTGLPELDPRTVPARPVPAVKSRKQEWQWDGKEEWLAKHTSLPLPRVNATAVPDIPTPTDVGRASSPGITELLAQLAQQIEAEREGAVDRAITRFIAELRASQSNTNQSIAQHLIAMKLQQEQFLARAAEQLGVEWDGFSTAVLNRAGFILKRALNGTPADLQVLLSENKRTLVRLFEYLQQIPAIQPEQPTLPETIIDGDDIAALMARLDELLSPFVTNEKSSADRDRLLTIYRDQLGRLYKKLSTLTMSTGHREMVVKEGKVNQ